jgi:hypothetical protein
MLAHQPPVVGDSILRSGAVLLLEKHFLVIDDPQDFVAHATAQLASILMN